MATNPTFWYHPDPDGSLEEIELNGPLTSNFTSVRSRARSTALNGVGSPSMAVWDAGERVRIERKRCLSAAVVRKLEALEDHLHRGGRVAFARRPTKAWCAYFYAPARGADHVSMPGRSFRSLSASAALASGDEVVIESQNPEHIREMRTVSSVNAANTQVTLSENVCFTREAIGLVRHRDFWPLLYLPDDQMDKPIVRPEFNGLAYTLEVELAVDPAVLAIAGGLGSDIPEIVDVADAAAARGHGLHTLDTVRLLTPWWSGRLSTMGRTTPWLANSAIARRGL